MMTVAHGIFLISAMCYGIFWCWAIWHAATTPKSSLKQRMFWTGSMVLNPLTPVWYWYIWKRWAFWLLFTPLLASFMTAPFIVKRLLAKSDAQAIENLVHTFSQPGSWVFLIAISLFVVFPLILRLVALLHLGKNKSMSALDRNDWIVALALPIFGFGAGIAYCAQHRRNWALGSLCWWVILAGIGYQTTSHLLPLLHLPLLR